MLNYIVLTTANWNCVGNLFAPSYPSSKLVQSTTPSPASNTALDSSPGPVLPSNMSTVASTLAEVRGPSSNVKRTPRAGKHRVSPLTQALDLKDIAYRDGSADSTPVHIKAALMRAWVDLQEMAMAIRGQGRPKPIEARNAKPAVSRAKESPLFERVAKQPDKVLGSETSKVLGTAANGGTQNGVDKV